VFSPAVVFLDFDGTITCRDVTDAVLERFAHAEWQDVEREWVAGRIGSRECLARQMALVRAEPRALDSLLDSIEVDPGFVPLLDACAARRVPVHIVSDGFDYCIRRVLGRPELKGRIERVNIVSSGLEWTGRAWRTFFANPAELCAHGCGTCKSLAIERLRGGAPVVLFAGDGLSDRHAAHAVSRVGVAYAKSALAAFCDERAIDYLPYDTLADVAVGVERVMHAAAHGAAVLKGV